MTLWLADKPLVLASKSTARRALLQAAAIPFEIHPAGIDERALEAKHRNTAPDAVATLLAAAKAAAVAGQMPDRLVLGADQTLACGTQRFSKPADREAAARQLRALSGKTHELHSAITLMRGGTTMFAHCAAARLTMRTLSGTMIERYLDTAGAAATASVGAYQIEGPGIHLFEKIDGDHSVILGLPLLPLLVFLRSERLVAS